MCGTAVHFMSNNSNFRPVLWMISSFAIMESNFIPYSYSVLLQCWDEQPKERPHFSELVVTLATMMEAVAGYLSFSASEKENFAADTSLLSCNSVALDNDSKK